MLINFYWSPEPLQFGDQVDFRIGTRSYDQLVYATDLVVFEKAKDIRFKVSGRLVGLPLSALRHYSVCGD